MARRPTATAAFVWLVLLTPGLAAEAETTTQPADISQVPDTNANKTQAQENLEQSDFASRGLSTRSEAEQQAAASELVHNDNYATASRGRPERVVAPSFQDSDRFSTPAPFVPSARTDSDSGQFRPVTVSPPAVTQVVAPDVHQFRPLQQPNLSNALTRSAASRKVTKPQSANGFTPLIPASVHTTSRAPATPQGNSVTPQTAPAATQDSFQPSERLYYNTASPRPTLPSTFSSGVFVSTYRPKVNITALLEQARRSRNTNWRIVGEGSDDGNKSPSTLGWKGLGDAETEFTRQKSRVDKLNSLIRAEKAEKGAAGDEHVSPVLTLLSESGQTGRNDVGPQREQFRVSYRLPGDTVTRAPARVVQVSSSTQPGVPESTTVLSDLLQLDKVTVTTATERHDTSWPTEKPSQRRRLRRPSKKPRKIRGGSGFLKFARTPVPEYGTPKPKYGTPKPANGTPKPGYGTPKPAYGTPKPAYGTPGPDQPSPEQTYDAPQVSPVLGNEYHASTTERNPAHTSTGVPELTVAVNEPQSQQFRPHLIPTYAPHTAQSHSTHSAPAPTSAVRATTPAPQNNYIAFPPLPLGVTPAPQQSYSGPQQPQKTSQQSNGIQQQLFTAPQQSYTTPQQSYTTPQQSYTTPEQSYTTPQQSYKTPQQSHTTPQQSYTTPQQSHTTPQQSYTTPQQSYTTPQQSYTTPQQSHTTPQQSYTTSQQSHTTPQQSYTTPQQSYTAPQQGYTVSQSPQQSYTNPQQSYTIPQQSYTILQPKAIRQQSHTAPQQSTVPQQFITTFNPQQSSTAPLQSYKNTKQSNSGQQVSYASPQQSHVVTRQPNAVPQQSHGVAPQLRTVSQQNSGPQQSHTATASQQRHNTPQVQQTYTVQQQRNPAPRIPQHHSAPGLKQISSAAKAGQTGFSQSNKLGHSVSQSSNTPDKPYSVSNQPAKTSTFTQGVRSPPRSAPAFNIPAGQSYLRVTQTTGSKNGKPTVISHHAILPSSPPGSGAYSSLSSKPGIKVPVSNYKAGVRSPATNTAGYRREAVHEPVVVKSTAYRTGNEIQPVTKAPTGTATTTRRGTYTTGTIAWYRPPRSTPASSGTGPRVTGTPAPRLPSTNYPAEAPAVQKLPEPAEERTVPQPTAQSKTVSALKRTEATPATGYHNTKPPALLITAAPETEYHQGSEENSQHPAPPPENLTAAPDSLDAVTTHYPPTGEAAYEQELSSSDDYNAVEDYQTEYFDYGSENAVGGFEFHEHQHEPQLEYELERPVRGRRRRPRGRGGRRGRGRQQCTCGQQKSRPRQLGRQQRRKSTAGQWPFSLGVFRRSLKAGARRLRHRRSVRPRQTVWSDAPVTHPPPEDTLTAAEPVRSRPRGSRLFDGPLAVPLSRHSGPFLHTLRPRRLPRPAGGFVTLQDPVPVTVSRKQSPSGVTPQQDQPVTAALTTPHQTADDSSESPATEVADTRLTNSERYPDHTPLSSKASLQPFPDPLDYVTLVSQDRNIENIREDSHRRETIFADHHGENNINTGLAPLLIRRPGKQGFAKINNTLIQDKNKVNAGKDKAANELEGASTTPESTRTDSQTTTAAPTSPMPPLQETSTQHTLPIPSIPTTVNEYVATLKPRRRPTNTSQRPSTQHSGTSEFEPPSAQTAATPEASTALQAHTSEVPQTQQSHSQPPETSLTQLSHGQTSEAPQAQPSHGQTSEAPQRQTSHGQISEAPQRQLSHGQTSEAPQRQLSHGQTSETPQRQLSHGQTSETPQRQPYHGQTSETSLTQDSQASRAPASKVSHIQASEAPQIPALTSFQRPSTEPPQAQLKEPPRRRTTQVESPYAPPKKRHPVAKLNQLLSKLSGRSPISGSKHRQIATKPKSAVPAHSQQETRSQASPPQQALLRPKRPSVAHRQHLQQDRIHTILEQKHLSPAAGSPVEARDPATGADSRWDHRAGQGAGPGFRPAVWYRGMADIGLLGEHVITEVDAPQLAARRRG